jgi:hypothetical protein
MGGFSLAGSMIERVPDHGRTYMRRTSLCRKSTFELTCFALPVDNPRPSVAGIGNAGRRLAWW